MEITNDRKLSEMVVDIRTTEIIETAGGDSITKRSKMASCDGTTERSIPREIVFSILLCLPADVLYNVMRYVCRMWNEIIRSPVFVYSHLEKSTGIVLGQRNYCSQMRYFSIKENCDIKVNEQECGLPVTIMGSCNGILLMFNKKRKFSLYLANPVTGQLLKLPPFPRNDKEDVRLCGFTYAKSSDVYKVVTVDDGSCEILTVGVDKKWRGIDTSHLNSTSHEAFSTLPISAGGYVHWDHPDLPLIFTMDVETETFIEIPYPQGTKGPLILPKGSSLCLMNLKGRCVWEVWVLSDPQNQLWEKLSDIDLHGVIKSGPRCVCFPAAWLQNGELVLFQSPYPTLTLIGYNVKTGEIIDPFVEESTGEEVSYKNLCSNYLLLPLYLVHDNSLVPLPVKKKKRSARLTATRKLVRLELKREKQSRLALL